MTGDTVTWWNGDILLKKWFSWQKNVTNWWHFGGDKKGDNFGVTFYLRNSLSTSKVHHESFHQQIEALLALSYILSPYFVFWWLLDLLGVLNSHILTEYYLVMLGLTPEEIFWTVGVTNVFLSAWLAGAFPYCYWIFHIFKFGSLLLLRCYKSL